MQPSEVGQIERKTQSRVVQLFREKLDYTYLGYNESLYNNNKNVYKLLRYGVPVKAEAGENFETVQLIDWEDPEYNDFAIAEEVTVLGNHEKRPDVVLYVNGIAIGVLELKRSIVSIGDGIRQSIVNQQKEVYRLRQKKVIIIKQND